MAAAAAFAGEQAVTRPAQGILLVPVARAITQGLRRHSWDRPSMLHETLRFSGPALGQLAITLTSALLMACGSEWIGDGLTTAEPAQTDASAADAGDSTAGPSTNPGEGTSGNEGTTPAETDSDTTDGEGDTEAEDTNIPCGGVTCDPGRQNCQDQTLKCTPQQCGGFCCTNATRCVDQTGDRQVGASCRRDGVRQLDDCAPGLFCMPEGKPSGQGGPGECIQLCAAERGSNGNCRDLGLPGQHCFAFNQGSLPVCLATCDPLEGNCENPEEACFLALDNFFCTRPESSHGQLSRPGEPCEFAQECGGGTVCAPPELDRRCDNLDCGLEDTCGCCAVLCDLSAERPDEACGDEEACVAVIEFPTQAVEHVGVCVVPRG